MLPEGDGVELLEVMARHLQDGLAEVAALVHDQQDAQEVEAGYLPEQEVCVKVAQEGVASGAWMLEESSGELPGEGDVVGDVVEQGEQQEEDGIQIRCSWMRADASVVLEVSVSLLALVDSRGQSL